MKGLAVGTGTHCYSVTRHWGKLPKGLAFGPLSAVAVDSKDRVYVFHRADPPIFVFDPSGGYVGSLGSGLIREPHGIAASTDDHLYLADREGHEVLKLTTSGQVVLRLGSKDHPSWQSPFNHPTDVAVSPTGDIYVSDGYGNSRIHRFTAQGELIASWGEPGSARGQFKVPHGISIDRHERVYVCDRDNHRIQIFSADGTFITEWTGFFRPMDIFIDPNEVVYVVDHTIRLTVLDRAGAILTCGLTGGRAHGIWGDSKGDLYTALEEGKGVEHYVKGPR